MQRLSPDLSAELIRVAQGLQPAALALRNARLLNVFTGKLEACDVLVHGDRVAGFSGSAKAEIDLQGAVVAPGFIDGHMHLESSMVTPEQFARAVMPRGTTTVITDPHEIANVLGAKGIHYMLLASRTTPLDMLVMLSSCVPATHLENAGATLSAEEIRDWDDARVLGLAEMMNFPGVVGGAPDCLAKIHAAGSRRVDGHAPRLSGPALTAYAAAGIESDHEATTAAEAEEKLRLGFHLMLREGSVTRDIEALLPAVNAVTSRRCFFVTDDKEPIDLLAEGHIDFCIRKAIRLGLDPVTAYTMASLNAAEYFGLKFTGAVAPGYAADLVVLDDLHDVRVQRVMKLGRWVAEHGRPLWDTTRADDAPTRGTVHLPLLDERSFELGGQGPSHVIELIPHQIVTGRSVTEPGSPNGADPERDLLKLAVIERHRATGAIGIALVRGFGLKRGAIASTVAHDSHNLIVAGTNDADMLLAARTLQDIDGGQVVVADGQVLATLPLPVAGLMSDLPIEEVRDRNQALIEATRMLGGTTPNPFMSLSFLALPVIPTLKLTDLGLVDVDRFEVISLGV
jgi:adenine deaminase